MALDRTALLQKLKLKTEPVELDGGQALVSEIGAGDYLNLWDKNRRDDGTVDMTGFTVALVSACVVDDSGQRIFSDADAELLIRSAPEPFFRLAEAARRINGLSGEEIKNSVETESGCLPSGSVSSSATTTQTRSPKS